MTRSRGTRTHRDSSTAGGIWTDERSQSVVIGTVLMFALGVALLGLLQVTLIPSANGEVEAEHSQLVRGQIQDLRNDIQRSAGSGEDFSQGVKLGTDYPPRAFFLNPGPAAGSINTVGTENPTVTLNVTNATALDAETDDYWNGTSRLYGTGAIVYRPGYNVYSGGPDNVTVENSLVYSQFDDRALLASDQRIVDGRRISLVALDGSLSQSQVNQYTVDTTAVSASSRTILVENTSKTEPITITIPTRLSEETLIQDVFASEIDDNGGRPDSSDTRCSDISADSGSSDRFINNCAFDSTAPGEFNNFTLIMENATYEVKLSKVGVGTGADDTSAEYITDIEGDGAKIAQGTSRELVVQVRDKYNNPVSNEKVTFSLDVGNGTLFTTSKVDTTINVTTDEDGEAAVGYQAPSIVNSSSENVEIDVSYTANVRPVDASPDFDASEPDDLTLSLEAINSTRTRTLTPLINPTRLRLEGAVANSSSTECGGGGSNDCTLTITWNNTANDPVDIQEIRYVFFSQDGQGNAPAANPGGAILTEVNGSEIEVNTGDPELVQAGVEKDIPGDLEVSGNSEREITLVVYEDLPSRTPDDIDEGEFIVLTLNVDGELETYFVAPVVP